MLTLTLVIAICLALGAVLGLAPGRASDQPPAITTITVTTERAVTPRYKGVSAKGWAMRFRHRTEQIWAVKAKAKRALRASLQRPVYGLSTDERSFMCIHGFEGSWTDSGAPFYGGLQMDSAFMATYGGWALKAFGTADHWPISVQLAVAIRAKVSGRGFYPWPNTARYCGLIG